ncbi:hypothetical protein RIR_jg17956.t1 [Rhizophagus irregularis DAOM 181602=DAOM 197198]|nr:hypothetical protein RIR_jg17956.t1 [Rhizophagus irregularis DAOM 181602=DAOM 197198]
MVHRTIHKKDRVLVICYITFDFIINKIIIKGNRSVIEVPFSTEPLDIRRVICFYWTFCVILFTTFDEIMYCIFKGL